MKKNKISVSLLLVVALSACTVLSGCGKTAGVTSQSTEITAEVTSQGTEITTNISEEPVSVESPVENVVDPDGTHTVVDATGISVEIPNTVDSIVVPFPAAAQSVLGLGEADLLTGGMILDTDMNKIIFPSAMKSIVSIRPSDLNVEVVMGCDPDFVVLASKGQAETLASANIPKLMFNASNSEGIIASTRMIAEAIGTDEALEKAGAYADFYADLKKTAGDMTSSIPEDERPVVYVCTGDDGLSTLGTDSPISEWVSLSGGVSVCNILNIPGFDATLTSEQIISADPDIIICTTVAGRDVIVSNPAYSGLKAIRNDKVYINPLGGSVWFKAHFEAPLELAWAPTVIAPEYSADLDTRSYVDDFFKTFYGYTITDADYDLIMNPSAGSN